MRSVSLICFVTVLMSVCGVCAQQIAGGFSEVSSGDKEVKAAAEFAVKTKDAKLVLQSIESSERQVVAGMNYKMVLHVTEGATAQKAAVVVWQKIDNSRELTSWEWVKPKEAQAGILKSEYIYDTGPYPSIHATTIVETPTGMVTAWFGGTAERNPDVCIWVSRLVDGKWTESVEVANGVQADGKRHPTWNPVLFQPKGAPLMLFYKVGPSPSTWWGELKTSEDGGKTWSAAQKLPEGIFGPIKNKPVQLANGDILCPTSNETESKPSAWAIYFERTSDLGKTWQRTELLHDGLKVSAIQPSILFLGGDKLEAVGRTRQGKVFQIESGDAGRTWGEISLTELPNPNSGTDAVTLKDGRHLLIYNHTAKGRSPLNLALSKDGKVWEAALVLEDEPKKEFSYPAIIQTSDGLVHITYTWKRQKVKHLVVDPEKLVLKPIVGGQWPQ
ncbi:exo-alpha-sialidase [Prosthecobacter sp.]|uniref:exo-alpha-sialidase n=1 Tax=Prosthecobacter sp. TaxID=1965333 RepID=UPI0037833947